MKRFLSVFPPVVVCVLLFFRMNSAAFDIPLHGAAADFEQAGYPASKTIDATLAADNGWAVGGATSVAHRIWWLTDGQVGVPGQERYEFRLDFRGIVSGINPFLIRRFVLSWTSDPVVSANSAWTPIIPDIAVTSNSSNGTLTIANQTGQVSLSGQGLANFSYNLGASFSTPQRITAFSIQVLPVSGAVGNGIGNNFILTEFTARIPNTGRIETWERNGAVPVTFSLNAANLSGTVIQPFFTAVPATAADYTAPPSLTLHANPNTYSFPVLNDSLEEPVELLIASIGVSQANFSPNRFYLIIHDDDANEFASCMSGFNLSGSDALPEADPNGDGITNLEAYVQGVPAAGRYSAATDGRPKFVKTTVAGNPFPGLTWQIPQPWPLDVKFTVQESVSMGSWTNLATRGGYASGSSWAGISASNVIETGTPLKSVTVPGSVRLSGRPKVMMRMKYELIVPVGPG
jgi:hypothetical protein